MLLLKYKILKLLKSHKAVGCFAVLQIGRSLVRSQLVSLEFFIDIKSFRSHYGPGVVSVSNRNEYQDYFLGVKSGRCVRLTTLSLSCAVVTKSGNLNFLEPSGPLQACNGTALPSENASQVSKSETVDHNYSYTIKLNAQLRARQFVRLSGYEYFSLKSLMYHL